MTLRALLSAAAAKAKAVAPLAWEWAKLRAPEKSTWTGLALFAAAVGANGAAGRLNHLGDVIPPLMLAVTGGGLMAAPTKNSNAVQSA